jgi:hypothetical protein
MISRKGALLIVGGSLVILLGAIANIIVSWNEEGQSFFLSLSDCSRSGCTNAQRISDLYTLGNHLSTIFSLIDGSLVPLALAAGGLGLSHLLRTLHSVNWVEYRWLAILGLACLTLSTIAIVLQVLIVREQIRLGDAPGRDTLILTHWLLRPPLWANLFGFLAILWGSFLMQKPTNAQGLTQ